MPEAMADPVSGSRLKAQYRVGDDGSKSYLTGTWYDSQRKETCVFERATDGKERCLPIVESYAYMSGTYSDAACTKPLAFTFNGCAPKYIVVTTGAGCYGSGDGLAYQVLKLGAKVSPATIYVGPAASCSPGQPSPAFEYYEVGAEEAPSSFVTGLVMTDP